MTWPVVLNVLTFLVVAAAEVWRPLIPASDLTQRRWLGNFGVYIAGALMLWLPPVAMVSAAVGASMEQFGLLRMVGLPDWLAIPLGMLLLDAAYYAVHRLYHSVGWLWRLHAVHHSDPELDVTTQVRHHPLETLIGTPLIVGATALLGVPPLAVVVYVWLETLVQALGHANLTLPRWVARLEAVLVTPDFHHLHHSTLAIETDSNYGQVFSVWDRLLGTFRPQTEGRPIALGLDGFRDERVQSVPWLLAQPLRNPSRAGAAVPAE
jgi:sterol desaturase/sphingolipid hydroxylase (fatty acid hydroxylase superfamily)